MGSHIISEESKTQISVVGHVPEAPIHEGVETYTVLIELPPGDEGSMPHFHPGPVFGYMIEGEMLIELEGDEPKRVSAGEAFWEPGGDKAHWQAANLLADATSRFIVVMLAPPGEEILTFLTPEQMTERNPRRHPSATAWR